MAFLPPAIRLKRVDLPTLGLPTIATIGFMATFLKMNGIYYNIAVKSIQ
jgi:hypothetical protein